MTTRRVASRQESSPAPEENKNKNKTGLSAPMSSLNINKTAPAAKRPSTRGAKAKKSNNNESSSSLSLDQDALMDAVNDVADCLEGLTIVVTGVFSSISREKIVEMLTEYGARNTGSVSGRTDYLISGSKLEDGRDAT